MFACELMYVPFGYLFELVMIKSSHRGLALMVIYIYVCYMFIYPPNDYIYNITFQWQFLRLFGDKPGWFHGAKVNVLSITQCGKYKSALLRRTQ